ncbi:MAG TPA: DUF11 domain-containing protein [Gemmataceae bacterium]|nr:DUF11 domain-containing protein [Gemmataceae bacterium]
MKAWLRSVRWMQGLALAGLTAALVVAVSRGQAVPGQLSECGEPYQAMPPGSSPSEPPMVGAPPMSPPAPVSPSPPFTPPSPTPLPPEQAGPFGPGLPFPSVEPTSPPVPMVRLRLRAPARVEPDKEIEYRLTVENVSRADAHHVLVRNRLPRGVDKHVRAEPEPTRQTKPKDDVTDLLWELGTLKAGQSKEIVLAIKPKGMEDVQNRAYVQFEHGQRVTTRIAKPGVRVKITVPAQAVLHESILFRIEVVNTEAVPLRNVILSEELPAGLELVSGKPEPNGEKPLTWKLGDVPPHQTRLIECEVISKKEGKLSTKVKVTADGGASATDSAAVTVGKAELKITTSGPPRRLANRPIPFHITVRNLGSLPLTNVQVSDELPRDIQFVSASPGGRRESGFVRWSLGSLPAGERRSLLMVVRAPKPGWCWNEATARADNNLSDKNRSAATRIESAGSPVIEIDKDLDLLDVGQKARYTIRLFNPGKANILHPYLLVTVPDEMSIRDKRGPTTGQQQGQNIRFDPIEVLNHGEEAAYVVEVEAMKSGEARLRVQWSDGRQDASPPETWEDKTIILGPAHAPKEPPPASLQVRDKDAPTPHDFSLRVGP